MTFAQLKPAKSLVLPIVLLTGFSLWFAQSAINVTTTNQMANAPLSAIQFDIPQPVSLAPHKFTYRDPARYIQNQNPQIAPLISINPQSELIVSKNLITNAQYAACVDENVCAPSSLMNAPVGDHPVVGINFDMATTYAYWLSRKTGDNWRLPTAQEWAQMAGDRYIDPDKNVVSDPNNPAVAWLSQYRAKSQSKGETQKKSLRPVGLFGPNNFGVNDVAQNIWVWTSTCYETITLGEMGKRSTSSNCGVRVIEGAHRSYLSTFITNPQGGGCTVGDPPDYLGIRLVKDTKPQGFWSKLWAMLSR